MNTPAEKMTHPPLNRNVPDIHPGDTVKVHQKIKEGNKERVQVFEGIVIAKKHGKGISATVTVRKVVDGVGVERIFPIHSPSISKIEVVASGKVRRAKLYYLRHAKGKKAKLKRQAFAPAIAQEASKIEESIGAISSQEADKSTTEKSK